MTTMRTGFGQATPTSFPQNPGAAAAPAARDIPYDYVARFTLTGRRGNRVEDVLNISVEGRFIAASIGYSFIPVTSRSLPAAERVIDFKYSIVDSATGRELQNRPIHNIAGLGDAAGERPFRALAKPMVFMPRSTIRFEIEEISEGTLYENAELFIVLHGYKVLGAES
jgi:hypothetical protein